MSAATGSHVPSAPLPFFAVVHASHAPAHALSQQTPSAQKPVAHCRPSVHALPFGSRATQLLVLHHVVAEQSGGSYTPQPSATRN